MDEVGGSFSSQNSKTHALFRLTGYVLLRYVLIYNLKVSFNFHTSLQLDVIKMFTVQ